MYNNKKVVVVLPAYNASKTLERTYAEIPFDVVDEVLAKYERKDIYTFNSGFLKNKKAKQLWEYRRLIKNQKETSLVDYDLLFVSYHFKWSRGKEHKYSPL